MNVNELILKASKKLKNEDARLISQILMAYILNCKKEELIIKQEDEVQPEEEKTFFKYIELIKNNYPLQYITHNQEFMKMCFYVDENVLVPRSDTETLVEETMEIINSTQKKKVLELCTGSGAIAVSLEKYLKDIEITATDISEKALEIAKENEKKLIEKPKIKFIKGNMFENIEEKFDLIVANPPYIETDIIKQYELKYEPLIALDGRKGWTRLL